MGNLVSRVASMVQRYQAGVVGDVTRGENDIQLYRDAMNAFKFNEALDIVWENIRQDNKYLEIVKPWEIAKKAKTDKDAEEHLSEVLQKSVGSLLQIADLLVPFLPDTAKKIQAMFENGTVNSNEPLFPRIYVHTPNPHEKPKKQ